MTAQQALEWAFGREYAQLDLPDLRDVEDRGYGFGTEYVILQRMKLGGVRIDVSKGKSYPHDDAEIIASIVAGHPVRRMAIRLAECARAGLTPDWMPGAVPQIEPVDWTGRGRSRRAQTEFVKHYYIPRRRVHPRNRQRTIEWTERYESRVCPVTIHPTPQQIASARKDYRDWWVALDMVRKHLQATDMLRTVRITDAMPPKEPWRREITRSKGLSNAY